MTDRYHVPVSSYVAPYGMTHVPCLTSLEAPCLPDCKILANNYPGTTHLRLADVVVIAKEDTAHPAHIQQVKAMVIQHAKMSRTQCAPAGQLVPSIHTPSQRGCRRRHPREDARQPGPQGSSPRGGVQCRAGSSGTPCLILHLRICVFVGYRPPFGVARAGCYPRAPAAGAPLPLSLWSGISSADHHQASAATPGCRQRSCLAGRSPSMQVDWWRPSRVHSS